MSPELRRLAGPLLSGALAALPATAAATDTSGLARSLAAAAARQAVRRIAVVPLSGPRGAASFSGSVLSERLVSGLLERGEVEVVERRLLETVLAEQRLGAYGIMEPRTARALGRVLGADAILTGTVVELKDERVEINARLVHAETARVIAASAARVDKDWAEPLGESSWAVSVPEFSGPDGRPEPRMDWRDAPSDRSGGCRGRLDALERKLLDLKARFWAAKLKDPSFSAGSLARNPGSEIENSEIRSLFYSRLHHVYYSGESRPLDDEERRELADGLAELRILAGMCGE